MDDPSSNSPSTLYPAPFIIGAPRSGTTLLRMMLDAHPDLTIPPETNFGDAIAGVTGISSTAMERFYHCIVSSPRWPDFRIAEDEFHTALARLGPFSIGSGLRVFYGIYADR